LIETLWHLSRRLILQALLSDIATLSISLGIDPANISVRPTINGVQFAMRPIGEYQGRGINQIHTHDCLANGRRIDRHCCFSNDDGIVRIRDLFVIFAILCDEDISLGKHRRFFRSFLAMVVAQAPFVAPRLLGNALGGYFERRVSVARLFTTMHLDVPSHMDRNIGAKRTAFPLSGEYDSGIHRLIEVIFDCFRQPGFYMAAKSIAYVDLFSCYGNLHQSIFFSAAILGPLASGVGFVTAFRR